MNDISYKLATFEQLSGLEVYQIGQLRQLVFVVEQNCNYLDLDGKDIDSLHWFATDANQQIIAYCRLLPVGLSYTNDCSIGRVANHQSVRGKGIGRELMRRAIELCKLHFGDVGIRISAQDYLLRFYNELGFVATNKKYLEDSLPHTQMYLV